MTQEELQQRPEGGLPFRRQAGLLVGPAVAAAIIILPPPADMPEPAWHMVAVAVWMVIWWLSEAVALAATALLPLVLMPLLALGSLSETAASYSHPLIFLFLGGFLLAAAVQRVGLHRRIALAIVAATGGTPARVVLGFMLATAFLSMWISNTAATIMMFAVGLSVIEFIDAESDDPASVRRFGVALMLGIAYSASIGGVATLIGTPPNALLASFLSESYGIEIGFADWMAVGLPVVAVMLPTAWLLLTRVLFATSGIGVPDIGTTIARQRAALGPLGQGERLVAVVFALTATAWILRGPLAGLTGLPLDDTMIALAAALVLFAIPVSRRRAEFALDWGVAVSLPWGILLLFGGGLALAQGFATSGLAVWIGQTVAGIPIPTLGLVLAVTAAMVFLTEITSNTASTATFLPILGAVALGLGLSPLTLCIPVAISASMAFMMPVATPPNAIVFSYGELALQDMVRAGLALNIAGIGITFAAVTVLVPLLFGFPVTEAADVLSH